MKNKIGRYLVIYDGKTEEVIEMVALENVSLEELKDLLDVPDYDPEMHDRYAVGPDEINALSAFYGKEIKYDFAQNAYFVEAIIEDC